MVWRLSIYSFENHARYLLTCAGSIGIFRLDVIGAAIIGAPIKRLVLLAAMIFDVNNKNKQS